MRNVSVSLNADNQIEVHVGSESRAGESYYLGLQPNSENHEFRPVEGTMQLVGEWIRSAHRPERRPAVVSAVRFLRRVLPAGSPCTATVATSQSCLAGPRSKGGRSPRETSRSTLTACPTSCPMNLFIRRRSICHKSSATSDKVLQPSQPRQATRNLRRHHDQ